MRHSTVGIALLLVLCMATQAAAKSNPFERPASSPLAEGMDSRRLDAMMAVIAEQNARIDSPDTIDSVIVIRHGNVLLEAYPNPVYDVDCRHHLFSVTKSITSLLMGIALELELVGSVEDSILDYFPDAVSANEVQSKSRISVAHMLTMSAGLEWDEDTLPTSHPDNSYYQLERSSNPVSLVLGMPMVAEPGDLFWYNTGISHVLGALIAKMSGMRLSDFAQEHLFAPLDIQSYQWTRDRTGLCKGGTQLYLAPRDLAKIGVLCLNGGMWDGEQIVPAAWLGESTRTHILGRPDYFSGRGYGYQWWTVDEMGVYYASGSQGQCLYIFPDDELVVVFTGTITAGDIFPDRLMLDYVLPALVVGE